MIQKSFIQTPVGQDQTIVDTDEWKSAFGKTMYFQSIDGFITMCYDYEMSRMKFYIEDKTPSAHLFDSDGNYYGRTRTMKSILKECKSRKISESAMILIKQFFETHPFK